MVLGVLAASLIVLACTATGALVGQPVGGLIAGFGALGIVLFDRP